uniref:TSA: Wollemia nobilis Ref_Wollemi_Transcript_29325_966 transcribed RNA sequence n=1 Tax=Wollemia nobilis TaxID=56998 RepID=A0A0C9RFV5_9CONI
MGDISGLLKVRVVKGTRLAVRDIRSSDPYVVLKLGDQVVKTRVINSNLNPVWDEELTLTISATTPRTLRVEVFDKDTFSADDAMGEAEIDLQPLAASVRIRKVLKGVSTATQVRKLVPSKENCLAKDSGIHYVDGTMIQDMCLRLRNVESGELEMQLKWVDLPASASASAGLQPQHSY